MRKLIFIFLIIFLTGCSSKSTDNLHINNFYQTNYSVEKCYDGTKTFSQIIICLQEIDKKEKTQNLITNNMLDNK
jgi:hypothetical protein